MTRVSPVRRAPPSQTAPGNRLFASFPTDEVRRLMPTAQEVPLAYGQTLFSRGDAPRYVYFPQRGLVSLVQRLDDGASVQVAAIGNEGMAGVAGALGQTFYMIDGVVQIPGVALRVELVALKGAMRRSPRLTRAVLINSARLGIEIALTAACNAHHTLEQRLARWLITAHDSVDRGELAISHGFLSTMLGTQRTGITAALAKLKRAGMVDTGYGGIAVLDRKALEGVACECYRNVRRLYAGPPAAPGRSRISAPPRAR